MTRLPVPGALGPVDYSSATPPAEYHCGKCGTLTSGVKLWRDYQTFLNHQSLLCADCACAEQNNGERTFTVAAGEKGRAIVSTTYTPDRYGMNGPSGDQIGWRVPAVPTRDGSTYWGYTSVPLDGVTWWKRLPLRSGGDS